MLPSLNRRASNLPRTVRLMAGLPAIGTQRLAVAGALARANLRGEPLGDMLG